MHISGTLAATFSKTYFIFDSRKEGQLFFRLDNLILPENSTQRLIRSYMTLVVEDEEAWPRIHHGWGIKTKTEKSKKIANLKKSSDAKWHRNNRKESNKKLTLDRISKIVLLPIVLCSIIFIVAMEVALFLTFASSWIQDFCSFRCCDYLVPPFT